MKNTLFKTTLYSLCALIAVVALGFSAKAFASEMVILSVSNPTSTTVTVSAKAVNISNDTNIRASFEYATNPSFASSSYTNEISQSTASTNFSQTITGLTPSTTYYVRALGIGNVDGVAKPSSTLVFKTDPAVVTSGPTANITSAKSAGTTTINVTMHYNLGSAAVGSVWFEYGTNSGSYPNKTNAVSVTNYAGTNTETISGLNINTTYYVRAVVQTSVATDYSSTALMVKTDNTVNPNPNPNPIIYVYGCMIKGDQNYNPQANFHVATACLGSYDNNNDNNWYDNWFKWGNTKPYEVVYKPIDNVYDFTDPKDADNSKKDSASTKVGTAVKNTSDKVNGKIAEKDYDANQYLASAFWGVGNGFFPTTLVGWLLLIFLILMLIVLTRHYFHKKELIKTEVKKA